jgi:hypothetical protein|uniref:Uncharacterized protein n=1 Tax=viral metagenome TaxID=1070528 RepID=A0A6C0IUT2_9ZZZZ
MDEINILIKHTSTKYYLILIVGLLIYMCLNKTQENMICDLDRPQYNYFFNKNSDMKATEITLLKSLFDKNSFGNNGYNKDNKSLSEYIKVNNLETKKDDFVSAVYDLLNNNRIWESINDYKVSYESKVSQLRHIWLIDKLFTDLACVLKKTEINKIKEDLKKMFNDKPIRLCNQDELKNYCSAVSMNPKIGKLNLNILEEEESTILKTGKIVESTNGKPSKQFKLISVKTNVSKFGKGYYKEPLNRILVNLLEKFEEKFSRRLDNYDRNDIVKLVLIYVPDLQDMINKNALLPKTSSDKKDLEIELDINKELFYLLKHQYKLVSIYNLINSVLKDPIEKELAYKCCSDVNDSTNKCFDFAEFQKESDPIVYGFNKYGYAKERSCTPEIKKDLFDLQSKTLEVRLSTNKFWNTINITVKNKFYKNLQTLLNYFTVKQISDDISKLSIANIINSLKYQNINLIFPKQFDTTKSTYINTRNNKLVQAIKSIELANSSSTIIKIVNAHGLNNNDFNFISLGNNIKKLKVGSINLLEIRNLLLNYRANESSVNQTMSRMLNLIPSEYNYHMIMIKGAILPRFHDVVLNKFFDIVSNINLIKLKPHGLNKKPSEVIKYIEKMFPPSKSMDTCSIYKPVLERLRMKRNISPSEYIYYKQELNKFCDSRDSLINKEQYILYKDIEGKLVETSKRIVSDYNKKDTKVLTVLNTNNQVEIVNLNEDELVTYTGLILKGTKLESINKLITSDTLTVVTSFILKNNKDVISKSKLRLDKNIVKDIVVEETVNDGAIPIKDILGKTKLDTSVTDKNKNLVNLINNYFDFDK